MLHDLEDKPEDGIKLDEDYGDWLFSGIFLGVVALMIVEIPWAFITKALGANIDTSIIPWIPILLALLVMALILMGTFVAIFVGWWRSRPGA